MLQAASDPSSWPDLAGLAVARASALTSRKKALHPLAGMLRTATESGRAHLAALPT